MEDSVFRKITYGMYIVSSVKDGRFNGQIVNTVFQITDAPAMIAVCINRMNLTREFIEASGLLSVSVLSEETPMTYIGRFGFRSGHDIDKFKDTKSRVLASGCPVALDHSLGYIEAVVKDRQENGAHTLYTCEVRDSGIIAAGRPLTYEQYHEIKKGLTPKSAPTYEHAKG
ncbi:MAG: flavin reductase family protein [Deltaproteobacteria bacterium]